MNPPEQHPDMVKILSELNDTIDAASFALIAYRQGKSEFFAADIQNAFKLIDASDELIWKATQITQQPKPEDWTDACAVEIEGIFGARSGITFSDTAIDRVRECIARHCPEKAPTHDKARLDWLENGGGVTDVFIDRDRPHFSVRLWPKIGPAPQYDGDSLRAAVDLAMRGEGAETTQH